MAVAERLGDPIEVAYATCHRGAVALHAGDWAQARVDFERAAALARQIGTAWHGEWLALGLARLCLAEGAWEEASRHLDEGVALVAHLDDPATLQCARCALAERDLVEGRAEAARARLVPLLDRVPLEGVIVPWLPVLEAWAQLEGGDVERAAGVVAQAISRARALRYQVSLVDALWVQARVAIRQERREEAHRSLEEGLALARSMPYPYAEARLLRVYGEIHLQKGEPGPARERLEAALAIFQRLGACKDIERVAQAIADLSPST